MQNLTAKKRARLEDWSYWPGRAMYGKVYGHPDFADGTEIKTSRIVSTDNDTFCVTLNTYYALGAKHV